MNPPPLIFPALGYATASANWVPTMASNALPPFCMISLPIFEASSRAETTIALSVTIPVGLAGLSLQLQNITNVVSVNINFIRFIVS